MFPITWKEKIAKYASGESVYLGRWKVGDYYWDSCQYKDGEDLPYGISMMLPGLKTRLKNQKTPELAKASIESAIKMWLEEAEKEID